MNSQIELENIIDCLNRAKKIGIFTHVNPDGDAIGSSMALYLALKQLNKEVDIIADEYSKCFDFLSNLDEIKQNGSKDYDLTVALDCATKGRLFDLNNSFDSSITSISIDHHASNTFFADYNYVEGKSPAACMTLTKILKGLNVSITKEIGEFLMAGIITDTGGFRHDTVDDETFEFAATMLDLGVNISDIYYRTFDKKSKAQFKLASIATERLKFYCNEKIALTYLTKEDFIKAKALPGDHEGIVNIGRNIEDVEVSIFLREELENNYKVSLRSNSYVNVSEIAEVFDGGGHEKAAGLTIEENLDNAIKKLIKETKNRL